MVASYAFKADMLSANRQLMGRLGLSLPSKEILLAAASAPSGRLFLTRGFAKIPLLKTRLACAGTEYPSEVMMAGNLEISSRVLSSVRQWVRKLCKDALWQNDPY